MNATITDSRLEQMMLHEAGCESLHVRGIECSITVTHIYRVSCIGLRKLVCTATAADAAREMTSPINYCEKCLTLVADCWSVVPV